MSSLSQLHTNLGHPPQHSLGRAVRFTGGSIAAVRAAFQLRCDVADLLDMTPFASLHPFATEYNRFS